jgi:hypothetical protein
MSARRVDEAYEAIRSHHHEHPYTGAPGRVYLDLGSLTSLLAALEHLTDDMANAVERAVGADDGAPVAHRVDAAVWLESARGALARARGYVEDAHANVGHLIFAEAGR